MPAMAPEGMLAGMANVAVPTKSSTTDECFAATCGLLRWGVLVHMETPAPGRWDCVIRLSAQVCLESRTTCGAGSTWNSSSLGLAACYCRRTPTIAPPPTSVKRFTRRCAPADVSQAVAI